MKSIRMISMIALLVCLCLTSAQALTIQQILESSYDSTTGTIRLSLSAGNSKDVTALTNTVDYPLTLTHETTGTPTAGIGVGLKLIQETSASNDETVGKLAAVMTDATAASEDADFVLSLMKAGAAASEAFRITSTGVLTLVNGETIDNTTDGTVTITSPVLVSTNSTSATVTAPVELHTNTTSFTVTSPILTSTNSTSATITSPAEAHVNTTSNTITSPIRAFVMGTTGGYSVNKYEATSGALSGATGSIAVNIPSGAKIIGCQMRVDTLITSGDGGTTWGAIFATGSTATVAANTTAFAKNTKVGTWFNENAATAITTGTTTITVAPNSGTFSAGVIRAICYAQTFTAMADAP